MQCLGCGNTYSKSNTQNHLDAIGRMGICTVLAGDAVAIGEVNMGVMNVALSGDDNCKLVFSWRQSTKILSWRLSENLPFHIKILGANLITSPHMKLYHQVHTSSLNLGCPSYNHIVRSTNIGASSPLVTAAMT